MSWSVGMHVRDMHDGKIGTIIDLHETCGCGMMMVLFDDGRSVFRRDQELEVADPKEMERIEDEKRRLEHAMKYL